MQMHGAGFFVRPLRKGHLGVACRDESLLCKQQHAHSTVALLRPGSCFSISQDRALHTPDLCWNVPITCDHVGTLKSLRQQEGCAPFQTRPFVLPLLTMLEAKG